MMSGGMTSDGMMGGGHHGHGYNFDPYKELGLPEGFGHGNNAFKKDHDEEDDEFEVDGDDFEVDVDVDDGSSMTTDEMETKKPEKHGYGFAAPEKPTKPDFDLGFDNIGAETKDNIYRDLHFHDSKTPDLDMFSGAVKYDNTFDIPTKPDAPETITH